MLGKAIKLAAVAFADKLDKGGKPYILHCLRVMMGVDQNDEELMQIAVLHDVLEDTEITAEDLRREGFSERVIKALELLTHADDSHYDTYIKMVSLNPDARTVKMADLIDNSQITRLKGLRKKDFDRMEKYHWAFTYLSN